MKITNYWGLLFAGFSSICMLAGACSSNTSSNDTSTKSAADSMRIKKPKHQIIIRPKKIDPLADPATEVDSAESLLSITSAERKNGWHLLFDGKDLNGWKGYNADTIGAAWKVKNGLLQLDLSDRDRWTNNHGGDLCTAASFADFDLSMDYRAYQNTNSGVLIRAQEGKAWKFPYETAVEMQILDDAANPDKTVPNHRSGSMFDLFASPPASISKPGVWNHLLIQAHGKHIIYILNGKKTVDLTLGSKGWVDSLNKSKFSKQKDFGNFKIGKIDLQEHGGSVDFKNIKIRI